MLFLYNVAIRFYYFTILVSSPFNNKARLWIRGRKGLFSQLRSRINPEDKIIWFHCSSLGEFEQGRPVIEKIRDKYPEFKIFLTFYSPSGYEIRKNYSGADYVFYMPLDTRRNARKFLDIVNPCYAYFVKYEFWYHFITQLRKKEIHTFLVSGIFRPGHVFLKWYGKWFLKILHNFNTLFVQDQESADLLETAGIKHTIVSGDTRFDRVSAITEKKSEIPLLRSFASGRFIFIAGSTWPEDEDLIVRFINEYSGQAGFIIAPHEIHETGIKRLEETIQRRVIRYTASRDLHPGLPDVLIIDTIGILSSAYGYADLAYIGGGFGRGIHNVLEAATFGLPVLFGPNYKKFREAIELINMNAAFSITGYAEFQDRMKHLFNNPQQTKEIGNIAKTYIRSKLGATESIIRFTLHIKDHTNYNSDPIFFSTK